MLHYEDEALIDCAWLAAEKLDFKLLVMSSVLAMNNRAFLGSMEDITKYLGIANNRKNKANINRALAELTRQGFIVQFKDKQNIIIALSYDAKNNSKVVSIQKTWINIIRQYKPSKKDDSVAWETILRVFIYLLGNCGGGITTYKMIASDLQLHENTIRKAVNALCNIDFGNLIVEKEKIVSKTVRADKTYYRCLGTRFYIMINFDGIQLVERQLEE